MELPILNGCLAGVQSEDPKIIMIFYFIGYYCGTDAVVKEEL